MMMKLALLCAAALVAAQESQQGCPEMLCAIYCDYGMAMDENGCPVCGCAELKCCDPLTEPGQYGNAFCTEGHGCCASTGEWSCSIGDGSISCPQLGFSTPPPGVACTPQPVVDKCAGFAGFTCSNQLDTCVDDPRDDCSPDNGGADCIGVCVAHDLPCSVNEDCATGSFCLNQCNANNECISGCARLESSDATEDSSDSESDSDSQVDSESDSDSVNEGDGGEEEEEESSDNDDESDSESDSESEGDSDSDSESYSYSDEKEAVVVGTSFVVAAAVLTSLAAGFVCMRRRVPRQRAVEAVIVPIGDPMVEATGVPVRVKLQSNRSVVAQPLQ